MNKLRLACAALTVQLLILVGCAQTAAGPDATPTVERFLAARQARNLDAAMACFADQPQLRSSVGVNSIGRDAVRAVIAARITDSYTIDNLRASGERVTWSQHVRRNTLGTQAPPATFDEEIEAVVRDDHIASMVTYANGAHPSPAAETSTRFWVSSDLLVPLGVLVLVAAAVLVGTSTAPVQTKRAPTLAMLDGLRNYVARRGVD
jgi:hypothetical protein